MAGLSPKDFFRRKHISEPAPQSPPDDETQEGDSECGEASIMAPSWMNERPFAKGVEMRRRAYEALRHTVGKLPPERGGVFLSRTGPYVIEDFIFDDTASPAQAVYYPNAAYLNDRIEREYEPSGYYFVGVAHSHPDGYWHPSGDYGWGDIKAARNNLLSPSNSHLDALFIPIVQSEATNGRFVLYPYLMLRSNFAVVRARVVLVD